MQPPKWADRLLTWYCRSDLLEEIQGDLYELYDRHTHQYGTARANALYGLGVLRFFRFSNIKNSITFSSNNSLTMFNNYLKIGWRNISKNPTMSLINIFGLALAIGWATTTYVFVDLMSNMDGYHSNGLNIYQIVNHVENDEGTKKWGDSPILLGPAAQSEIPEIEQVFRMKYQHGSVKYGHNVFQESLLFVDPAFFTSLDFDFLNGPKDALTSKGSVVISYNTAIKYFEGEDPIGKQISVKFSNGLTKSFQVAAVLAKFPYNTSLRDDFYFSMEDFFGLNLKDRYDWSDFTDATFIMLSPGASAELVTQKLSTFIPIQNEQEHTWKIRQFELVRFRDLFSKVGYTIEGSVVGGDHPAGRISLSIVAFALVLMACFNYMNISLTTATRRLKEIALRKVVGGYKKQIIYQFLIENYLQVFFALIVGLILCITVFLPIFNMIIPISIPFKFSSITGMIWYFVVLVLAIGLISSVYPSLYISRFSPVEIFKGKERLGSKNVFSKILTGLQLVIAFVTVVAGFLFTDNILYMNDRKWGYDAQGLLVVDCTDPLQVKELNKFTSDHSYVTGISGTANHVGYSAPLTSAKQIDKDLRAVVFHVGKSYPRLLNIELVSGGYFNENLSENQESEILVNTSFVEKMGWETAIGQKVVLDSVSYTVSGVTTDFEYEQFFGYREMMPAAMVVTPEDTYKWMVLKTTPDKMDKLQGDLQEAWLTFAPHEPLDVVVQTTIFDPFYRNSQANIIIMMLISSLAIIIACLGLFGIASFNIQRKVKEISIRKILGAQPGQIIHAASKDFVLLIVIAFVIGAPVGFFLISNLIVQIYPDPKPTSILPFLVAVLVLGITILITLSGQFYKALNINPAKNLRTE